MEIQLSTWSSLCPVIWQVDEEAMELNKELISKLLELDDVDAVYSDQKWWWRIFLNNQVRTSGNMFLLILVMVF